MISRGVTYHRWYCFSTMEKLAKLDDLFKSFEF